MSSVRMCDKCGEIFSENAEGWSTYSGSVKRRGEKGGAEWQTLTQDACPACTNGTSVPTPRLAIPAGKPDYAKIAELERETGVGQE